jgi:hypothetical protein
VKLDRQGRRRVLVAVPVVAAGVIVVCGVLAVLDQAWTEADGLRVYCLAPERHEKLVAAADALDLAEPAESSTEVKVPGAELEPEEWRKSHAEDFEQACAALSAAERPRSPGVFVTVLPFLTALVGAGGAFAATSWRDRVMRAHSLAEDLRVAAGGFFRAADDYLTNWRPGWPDTELVAQRVALAIQVSRAKAAHGDWEEVRKAEAVLTTGELGPSISTGWRTGYEGEAANEDRRAELRALLATTRDELFALADRLQRPLRAEPNATAGGGS